MVMKQINKIPCIVTVICQREVEFVFHHLASGLWQPHEEASGCSSKAKATYTLIEWHTNDTVVEKSRTISLDFS